MARTVNSDVKSQPASIEAQRRTLANDYATKLAGDQYLTVSMETYTEAKKKVRQGSLLVYIDLKATLTADMLANLPEPGTENTDETPTNNPDKYKYQGTNAKGNRVMLTGSFYSDLFELLPFGKKIAADREELAKAGKLETRSEARPEWQQMTPLERLGVSKTLDNKRSNGIEVLKRAANIARQFEASKLCPLVKTYLMVDKQKTMVDVSTPIIIRDADTENKPDTFDTISDSTFLRLDYAAAAAMPGGGTFEELVSTTGRDDTGDDDESDVPSIDSNERFEDYSAEYAHAMTLATYKAFMSTVLKAQKPEHDDLIVSWFTILAEMETVLGPHGKRQDLALERINARNVNEAKQA